MNTDKLREVLQQAIFLKHDVEKLNEVLAGTGVYGISTRPFDELIMDITRKLENGK